jgi:cell wall-associated NlpC family hydrolase
MFMQRIKRVTAIFLMIVLIGCAMPVTAYAKTDFKIGVAMTTGSYLRLREGNSLFSKVLDHAEKNEWVVVLDKVGDWYKVNYNMQEGYMHGSFLKVIDKENVELGYGKVCGDGVNFRRGPSTRYQSLEFCNHGDIVYIIGINNGWYKAIFEDNIGYIRSDYVDLTEIPYENHDSENDPLFFKNGKWVVTKIDTSLVTTGRSDRFEHTGDHDTEMPNVNENVNNAPDVEQSTQPIKPNNPLNPPAQEETIPGEQEDENEFGKKVVATAEQYLGIPYVWGGTTPSGFDCSGFVYYVFNQADYPLSRSMSVQYKTGVPVAKEDLRPGDIVFFQGTYTSGMSHVGIYVGDGQFIHSPRTGRVVSYEDLYSKYYVDHYYGACRVEK